MYAHILSPLLLVSLVACGAPLGEIAPSPDGVDSEVVCPGWTGLQKTDSGLAGDVGAEGPESVWLALSEDTPRIWLTAELAVELLEIRDSRCPTDVVCVSPGSAEVDLRVVYQRNLQTVTLSTLDPIDGGLGGYSFTLHSVQPVPTTDNVDLDKTATIELSLVDFDPAEDAIGEM